MVKFKKHFEEVPKTLLPDLPAGWKGKLFKCMVHVEKKCEDGTLVQAPCGTIVMAPI